MNTIIDIEQRPSEKAMISRQLAYYRELQKLRESKAADQPSSEACTDLEDKPTEQISS